MEAYIDDQHKPKMTGTTRVFKNDTLEWLSRTHISIPLIIFSSISSGLIYYGLTDRGLTTSSVIVLFVSGLLFFTLVEYLIHRFLFHLTPKTPAQKKFAYTAHGVHHDFPKDRDRLVMPIPASLTFTLLFFLIYQLIMGVNVYGFLPGFLMGYAAYLWVHYMVHAFRPPKNFFKILWVHHGIHHYKEPNRAFGVSSPLWDVIFRTMPTSSK